MTALFVGPCRDFSEKTGRTFRARRPVAALAITAVICDAFLS
ncbi:hypothetical protein [Mesorhizobium sp. M8A.F.Ca.ET.207.01.1.1]|nr:hypothetical protein [Mesorhizobium sp. M8A.F.Ca.ET.207.01.1.1]